MKTYVDADDVVKLEETAKYLRDRLLVRLLFRLGYGISEVLGISVGDIDYNQGTIFIQQLKTRSWLFVTVSRMLTGRR